ncbi:MAG: aminotransferase class IV, partial [Bacteroidales bacterium]|nr:aminotransferase class IV [Bacteroidales bacterium]
MGECIGRFYINHGALPDCPRFVASALFEGESVYELVRVIEMVPLFFEDHLKRLENSAVMIGRETGVSSSGLLYMVIQLILKNDLKNGNLKIFMNFTDDTHDLYLFVIESQYPDPEMYNMGVPAILYYAERRNPTA